jgi:two-component system, OmpR family, sensor histidine kinase ChvG
MSIRTKLMLVALLFMAIPVLAYEFVLDMSKLLQGGLEKVLMLEARAVARVLHERSELFDPKTGIPLNQENRWHLYAQPTFNQITVDGDSSDWVSILQNARFFGNNNVLSDTRPESDDDISFWHILAFDESWLYVLFQVKDDRLVVGNSENRQSNDHLRVYLRDGEEVKRFLLTFNGDEPMKVYAYKHDWNTRDWKTQLAIEDDESFYGRVRQNNDGYNIELKISLDRVIRAGYIGFDMVDVDDMRVAEQHDIPAVIISTVNPERTAELNRVLLRSPQIETIIKGLDQPSGRIWVVDQFQRVRALAGSLQPGDSVTPPNQGDFLDSLFNYLLSTIHREFTDLPSNTAILANKAIGRALSGKPENFTRPTVDEKATIVGATYPIEVKNKIIGAVVVEKTTNEILALQNEALRNVVKRTFLIMVIAVVTLVWFATRLVVRIKRLQAETSEAIDEKGRVVKDTISGVKSRDELGKLSSSIDRMIGRLSQHTSYLERMPRTLRHEILNPLNVLNTSVENLEKEVVTTSRTEKYIGSLKTGIRRLASILHSLTEAANLDEALASDEEEFFDLNELMREYLDNYREYRSNQRFELALRSRPLVVFGLPEYIAQMLDKIMDNAIDFTEPDEPIYVGLSVEPQVNQAVIVIRNRGAHIPEEIRQNLFESMVSIRPDSKRTRPHLGIGLYVARIIAEAHQGKIEVENTTEPDGVAFRIVLPLNRGPYVS